MEITTELRNEAIVDALIGAFEGGSNYWYYLPNTDMVEKIEGKALSERITLSALNGAVIPVNDLEMEEDEPTLLGYISKENIERGLKLYIEDGRGFDPDEMDADDSDVLLQFIVMGEIIFG